MWVLSCISEFSSNEKKKKSILEGGYQASSSHTHAHTQGPPPFVSCEIRARHLTSRALSSLPGVMTPDPA